MAACSERKAAQPSLGRQMPCRQRNERPPLAIPGMCDGSGDAAACHKHCCLRRARNPAAGRRHTAAGRPFTVQSQEQGTV